MPMFQIVGYRNGFRNTMDFKFYSHVQTDFQVEWQLDDPQSVI